MMSAISRPARLRHLPSRPSRSQTTTSRASLCSRPATRFEPMKPAPPVTTIIAGASPGHENSPSPLFPCDRVPIIRGQANAGAVHMQTSSRFFDDIARVAGGALGAAAGLRNELEAMVRDRLQRMMSDMDLVPREEFEAVREMAAKARAEQE